MKIKGLIIGIIFFTIGILLSTGTFVRAEDSNESLVNLLGRKGVLTDQEVNMQKESLKKEKEENKKQEEAGFDKKGLLSSLRGYNVKLYGTMMPMYTYISSDHDAGKNTTSSFEFRKARIGVMGSLTKNIDFNIQFESAATSNATSLLDAYIQFKQFDDLGIIAVGQQYCTIEDLNSVSKTILTDRIFPQLFLPERSKGVTIGKGQGDAWYGKGFFGDRIGYWFGAFNVTNDRRNVSSDLLYTGRIMLTPFGSLTGDEYNIKFSPLKVQLTGGAATSRDTNASVTGNAQTKVKNNFYASGFQLEARGWYFMAEWSRKAIDAGNITPKRETNAYFVGATRSFALPFKNQFLGVGFAWQKINNEDPSVSALFGPRTATSSGVSFDKGNSYHPVINYMITPNIRLQAEYAMYREDGKKINNDALFSRLSFVF